MRPLCLCLENVARVHGRVQDTAESSGRQSHARAGSRVAFLPNGAPGQELFSPSKSECVADRDKTRLQWKPGPVSAAYAGG